MEADFQGYVTKANLVCSDGLTIMPNAFGHQDSMEVPLVWMHTHNDPEFVLGHAILENREDGVWARAFFNNSPKAQHAKQLVIHGDIKAMSIWANQLFKKGKNVLHGVIREVSLVLAGANPGALIDPVTIRHGDGEDAWLEEIEGEAIITTGDEIEVVHASDDGNEDEDGPTVQEVYDSLSDEQKEVVHFMIGEALASAGASVEQSATEKDNGSTDTTDQEGTTVTHNPFEKGVKTGHVLTHDAMEGIFAAAQKGGSFKEALHAYAEEHLEHGITDIETLFPEAQAIDGKTPSWITRRMEWVSGFLGSARKSPFSRIKSHFADLTLEDARAKGYIKGTLKKEQFFATSRRTTEPKTIYKKQKLDRDDIIDITDFDVVAWIRQEMRFMLEEEIARAALIGDGREVDDEDKIDEDKIRPIATDDEFYVTTVYVNVDDASSDYNEVVDALILHRSYYRGTGTPNFYTTEAHIAQFLTIRDGDGKRMYRTLADVAAELRVNSIIAVEVMESEPDIVGIMVNPADYTFGASRGGEITNFEDFDIDYNQYKYLIETRLCGALTLPKSAVVVRKVASGASLVTPTAPTFDPETGALTITDTTGVVYKNGATVINAAGSPYTVDPGETYVVDATPASGSYYFASSAVDQWSFTADE